MTIPHELRSAMQLFGGLVAAPTAAVAGQNRDSRTVKDGSRVTCSAVSVAAHTAAASPARRGLTSYLTGLPLASSKACTTLSGVSKSLQIPEYLFVQGRPPQLDLILDGAAARLLRGLQTTFEGLGKAGTSSFAGCQAAA